MVCCFTGTLTTYAQIVASPELGAGGGGGLNNLPGMNLGRGGASNINTDSTGKIKSDWDATPAKIYYKTLNSDLKKQIDTSITYFHHYSKSKDWDRDLGNANSASYNMLFTPEQTLGFSSGFTAYNAYIKPIDSIRFYNTTRPYTDFSFMMGSKKQQNVSFMHTQNVNSRFNVSGNVQNYLSPGFFVYQQTKRLEAGLNSNYKSKNERYQLFAAYNYYQFKQDENGGIQADSLLNEAANSNRNSVAVNLPGRGFSTTVAAVNNVFRKSEFVLQHAYALVGTHDTLYNEDSTKITPIFLPRFTLHHQLKWNKQSHFFNDVSPEVDRYADFTGQIFPFVVTDSVWGKHSWTEFENRFGISGTVGKHEDNLSLQVGIANKIDNFKNFYIHDNAKNSFISNYVYGKLTKEAQTLKQWSYGADASLYFSGQAAGNFLLNAYGGKVIKSFALLQAGFKQSLSEAPYYYQAFRTNFYERNYDLKPVSITNLWGSIAIPKYKASLGVRNLLLSNYAYLNQDLDYVQHNSAINVLQISAQKNFKWGIFHLDNEGVYQQTAENSPVNVPALMLRHQLRIETFVLRKLLQLNTGLEVRYQTAFHANGYSAYLNQFYTQNTVEIENKPEFMFFFDFKIKRFRAFVVLDNLQRYFWTNNMAAPGYPTAETTFRFGFNWILYN